MGVGRSKRGGKGACGGSGRARGGGEPRVEELYVRGE